MKTALLQLACIVGLAFLAGTAYTLLTGKLEFFVSSSRYPNALVCKRSPEDAAEEAAEEARQRSSEVVGAAPATSPEATRNGSAEDSDKIAATPDSETTSSPSAQASEEGATQGIPHIRFEEAHQAWLDGILFVDARPSKRYEEGHIPGAVSIPAWEAGIEQKVEELSEVEPLAAPVVIYCTRAKDCEDSHIVGSHLESFGYLDLRIFEGGFPEWREREMPVREGEEPGPRGMVEEGTEP